MTPFNASDGHFPHLNNAPIVEAIIDYRVSPRPGFKVADLQPLEEGLRGRFPTIKPIFGLAAQLQWRFDDQPDPPPQTQRQHLGMVLRNAENSEAVQLRVDGFSFSKLRPYSDWEDVYGKATAMWRDYAALAAPVEVSRVAVRYINRFSLDLPITEMAEYLRIDLNIPPELPQQIRHFANRVILYEPTDLLSAAVTIAMETPLPADQIVILFDTDAFRDDLHMPWDSSVLGQTFTKLRSLKNRIFFLGLTEKMLERFQ